MFEADSIHVSYRCLSEGEVQKTNIDTVRTARIMSHIIKFKYFLYFKN